MIVALDLDGTLLTCAPRHCAVTRYSLAAAIPDGPIAFDAAQFWDQKRNGRTTRECLSSLGANTLDLIADIWLDQIENINWLSMDSLLPGVESALSEMRKSGATLALVSARRNPTAAHAQLRHLHMLGLFDAICFVPQHEVVAAKSRVLLDLAPALYIGDTELDFSAATAAGIPCRLVNTGSRSKAYLESLLPAISFPSVLEAFRDGLDI